MIPKVPVKKMMSDRLFALGVSESALRAAEVMTEYGIGCVLVTRAEKIVGITTETDLIRKVLGAGCDPKQVTLETIMSFPPISIDENASLEEAYKLMGQNQIRHLLITRDGQPCGIISARTFLESIYP